MTCTVQIVFVLDHALFSQKQLIGAKWFSHWGNIAEQKLVEAVNRGWSDKSAYTVTFLLQEEAAQVELRADGIDPQQAGKYISTNLD